MAYLTSNAKVSTLNKQANYPKYLNKTVCTQLQLFVELTWILTMKEPRGPVVAHALENREWVQCSDSFLLSV